MSGTLHRLSAKPCVTNLLPSEFLGIGSWCIQYIKFLPHIRHVELVQLLHLLVLITTTVTVTVT